MERRSQQGSRNRCRLKQALTSEHRLMSVRQGNDSRRANGHDHLMARDKKAISPRDRWGLVPIVRWVRSNDHHWEKGHLIAGIAIVPQMVNAQEISIATRSMQSMKGRSTHDRRF